MEGEGRALRAAGHARLASSSPTRRGRRLYICAAASAPADSIAWIPFLLLDRFESVKAADYEAGFPYHPHRGIETVTLVRKGEVKHSDSLGHEGSIGAGDIQWMTSGSGILHEEMPQVRPEGIAGLQIWLNLPARDKMSRPKYRDLQGDRLAETKTEDGASIRVIAGEARADSSRGRSKGSRSRPSSSMSRCRRARTFREEVPRGHTAFAYVDHGDVRFGAEKKTAHAPSLVIFAEGDVVEASAGATGAVSSRRGAAAQRADRALWSAS